MFNNPYMYTGNFANMYGNGMMGSALGGASRMVGGNMLGGASRMVGGNMLGGASRMAGGAMRGGLFGRLGGIASAIRGVNWGGFINNASKTIGVINQTIPLVKQAGPMIRNVKSVMKIASVFKDETDPISTKNNDTVNNNKSNNNTPPPPNSTTIDSNTITDNYINDSSPMFFVS